MIYVSLISIDLTHFTTPSLTSYRPVFSFDDNLTIMLRTYELFNRGSMVSALRHFVANDVMDEWGHCIFRLLTPTPDSVTPLSDHDTNAYIRACIHCSTYRTQQNRIIKNKICIKYIFYITYIIWNSIRVHIKAHFAWQRIHINLLFPIIKQKELF